MEPVEEVVWAGSSAHERLGPLWVAASARGLVAVVMQATKEEVRSRLAPRPVVVQQDRVAPILAQLDDYLRGNRTALALALDWSVLTSFQRDVLQLVHAIPYGQTRTYGEIAAQLGKPGAARAVGRANATNPMPLAIPCHRVLGSDGRLHGYGGAGGVETKAWLLRLEGSRLL